jgi:hypothetical protein
MGAYHGMQFIIASSPPLSSPLLIKYEQGEYAERQKQIGASLINNQADRPID